MSDGEASFQEILRQELDTRISPQIRENLFTELRSARSRIPFFGEHLGSTSRSGEAKFGLWRVFHSEDEIAAAATAAASPTALSVTVWTSSSPPHSLPMPETYAVLLPIFPPEEGREEDFLMHIAASGWAGVILPTPPQLASLQYLTEFCRELRLSVFWSLACQRDVELLCRSDAPYVALGVTEASGTCRKAGLYECGLIWHKTSIARSLLGQIPPKCQTLALLDGETEAFFHRAITLPCALYASEQS